MMFAKSLMKAWLLLASCGMALVAGQFQASVELTEGKLQGTLESLVTLANPDAGGKDTITLRYTVPQIAWVAVGFNPTGGGMVNGEVVIGKPDEGTILKYKMTLKGRDGIEELPNQTLLNASLDQADGKTVLTFTKLLVEDGEFSINPGTVNTVIAGFGFSNIFGFHEGYGVQAVNLPAGSTDPAPTDAPTATPPASNETFVEQVAATGEYNTLVGFLEDPLLQAGLASAGSITVFGPNDAAFAQIDLDALSPAAQTQALSGHVVSGVYTAADVKAAGCVMLDTIVNTKLRAMYVEVDHSTHSHVRKLSGEHEEDHIMINEGKVILADIADGTSIFHGLDTVLLSTDTFECPTEAPAPTDAPAPTEAPVKGADSASPYKIGGSILLTAMLSALAFIF